jgi:lipid-A-disaccharide synthase
MRIGIIAGEASGDLLGAGLMREFLKLVPDAQFEGVAGPAMQAAGCKALEQADALALFGLIEPLIHIPRLLRLRRELVQHWIATPPDAFVGIDAPDFNLGLEKTLRDAGIRTAQYVSPSVWAWRQGRVRKVAKAVDKVLCLLPFEKAFYDAHQVSAEFVGHPLADRIEVVDDVLAARRELGIDAQRLVAVLPGSRGGEVARLGRVFADTCQILAQQDSRLHFVAPMANDALRAVFEEQAAAAGISSRLHLLDGNAQSAMAAADVVLLASGTAALEAALIGRPMVAAYRLAPVTYAIAKLFRLVRVKYFTLPNLLTAEPLVEEFVQYGATPEALAAAIAALLDDDARRRKISATFRQLYDELAQGADQNAARAILKLAQQ